MKTTRSALAAFLATLSFKSVIAVPNVTVVPLGSQNCVQWPGWIPTPAADTTGSLQFQVYQSDDVGIEGLYSNFPSYDSSNVSSVKIDIDLRKSLRIAKSYYRCNNGVMQLGYADQPAVSIAKDKNNALLTFGLGYKLEPYAHYVDGVQQPGVFLGALNQTTWGFNYLVPSTCGQIPYYQAALQGLPVDPNTEPTAGYIPEFFGFIQAVQF